MPCFNIREEKLCMMGLDCICSYRSISPLRQCPINFMMMESMPEKIRVMAPATRREQEDTSLAVKPRSGTHTATTALSVYNIIERVMFFHCPEVVRMCASEIFESVYFSLR